VGGLLPTRLILSRKAINAGSVMPGSEIERLPSVSMDGEGDVAVRTNGLTPEIAV